MARANLVLTGCASGRVGWGDCPLSGIGHDVATLSLYITRAYTRAFFKLCVDSGTAMVVCFICQALLPDWGVNGENDEVDDVC